MMINASFLFSKAFKTLYIFKLKLESKFINLIKICTYFKEIIFICFPVFPVVGSENILMDTEVMIFSYLFFKKTPYSN